MSILIVFEGVDGAGGETQTKLLVKFLLSRKKETEVLSYPNPESPIGKIIYDYLNKKLELSPNVQMSLYATDMALDREKIITALEKNKVVIANRYFLSTLAYQCGAKGVPLKRGLEFAKIMNLPVPDIVIYLDISPETSLRRKFGEKKRQNKKLDRHEEDQAFLAKVREAYKNLVKEKVFAKEWAVVDAEKNIEAVATDVQKIVLEKLE